MIFEGALLPPDDLGGLIGVEWRSLIPEGASFPPLTEENKVKAAKGHRPPLTGCDTPGLNLMLAMGTHKNTYSRESVLT